MLLQFKPLFANHQARGFQLPGVVNVSRLSRAKSFDAFDTQAKQRDGQLRTLAGDNVAGRTVRKVRSPPAPAPALHRTHMHKTLPRFTPACEGVLREG